MPRKKILHATLEYVKRVGGVGAVTTGLTPALVKKGFDVAVVTPFYDVYEEHYKDKKVEYVTNVTHIYKGEPYTSNIFRVLVDVIDGEPLYHYLVKPADSKISRLFEIKHEGNIYQAFPWSETAYRMDYFNSAVAAMLRQPNDAIPQFDLYHSHIWHTGLANVLAKEMENLPKWRALYKDANQPLKKIIHSVSTIHMLLEHEHGQLTSKERIAEFLHSVGLPENFIEQFGAWSEYINPQHLKQVVLSLLYADQVTIVSEGLAHEAARVKGGGQGLDDLFAYLDKQGRFQGILNGINFNNFDATNPKNLGEFTIDPNDVTASKSKIKQYLAAKYPKLDPNKMWYGFIARFAHEKGVDMLPYAAEAIARENGIFIVMGVYVNANKKDGKSTAPFSNEIDALRKLPNVLVIDDPEIQKAVGKLIRAGTDCTVMLSHNEACGLAQIEGFANGSFTVAPRVQGIPDSVKDLNENPQLGTGFLYSDHPSANHINLQNAINKASKFYKEQLASGRLQQFLKRLMNNAKQFDWNGNPASKYTALYERVLNRAILTSDQIRNATRPILHMFRKLIETSAPNSTAGVKINNSQAAEHKNGKIFQVGFNKCGSQMLYYGFRDSGVPALHFGTAKRPIGVQMRMNEKNGLPLLDGIDNFDAYFDFDEINSPPDFTPTNYFKKLDQQYPGSKFILNTRDKQNWLISRLSHIDPETNTHFADIIRTEYGCTIDELIAKWSKQWDEHHKAVREYFKDRPDDLLEFNIETDSPQKLCDFFSAKKLNPDMFKVINKTAHKQTTLLRPELVISRPISAF